MANFDNIFQASIGGASFQLDDYSVDAAAVIVEKLGHTCTKITVQGEGWVEADNSDDFAAALEDAGNQFQVDGEDFTITGLNGITEMSITSDNCVDGGPFCSFKALRYADGGSALVKRFTFTVSAVVSGPNPAEVSRKYKTKVTKRPDSLRVIEVTGVAYGLGALSYYQSTFLPEQEATYPASGFVQESTYESDVYESNVSFTLKFTETAYPYPIGPGFTIVDGEQTSGQERDEQFRLTTTTTYNLLLNGDPVALRNFLRPQAPTVVLRESSSITNFHEQRLQCSFTVLTGANGNKLMDWGQTLTVSKAAVPLTGLDYANGTGLLGRIGSPPFIRVKQRGRAIGCGAYVQPPPRILDISMEEHPGEETYSPLNTVEKETTWLYQFITTSEVNLAPLLPQLERPTSPTFY